MENKPAKPDPQVGESIILWNDPSRDGREARRKKAQEDFWRWTPQEAFERRLYGLLDRIKRRFFIR